MDRKVEMLACHASQRAWLVAHHGMDENIDSMRRLAAELRGGEANMPVAAGIVNIAGTLSCETHFWTDYSVPQLHPTDRLFERICPSSNPKENHR